MAKRDTGLTGKTKSTKSYKTKKRLQTKFERLTALKAKRGK